MTPEQTEICEVLARKCALNLRNVTIEQYHKYSDVQFMVDKYAHSLNQHYQPLLAALFECVEAHEMSLNELRNSVHYLHSQNIVSPHGRDSINKSKQSLSTLDATIKQLLEDKR